MSLANMPPKHRDMMSNIYPLSDALVMNLYMRVRKGKKGKEKITLIAGANEQFALPVSEGITIPLDCKIMGSNVEASEAWLLLHIKGNLYAFISYLADSREVYFWLVDGAKANLRVTDIGAWDGWGSIAMGGRLKQGRVACYRRTRAAKEWSVIDGPDRVDSGQSREAEEERREGNQEVGSPAQGK